MPVIPVGVLMMRGRSESGICVADSRRARGGVNDCRAEAGSIMLERLSTQNREFSILPDSLRGLP